VVLGPPTAANAGWAIPAETSEAITTAAAAIVRFMVMGFLLGERSPPGAGETT